MGFSSGLPPRVRGELIGRDAGIDRIGLPLHGRVGIRRSSQFRASPLAYPRGRGVNPFGEQLHVGQDGLPPRAG